LDPRIENREADERNRGFSPEIKVNVAVLAPKSDFFTSARMKKPNPPEMTPINPKDKSR
jgi:hypothetical protein